MLSVLIIHCSYTFGYSVIFPGAYFSMIMMLIFGFILLSIIVVNIPHLARKPVPRLLNWVGIINNNQDYFAMIYQCSIVMQRGMLYRVKKALVCTRPVMSE